MKTTFVLLQATEVHTLLDADAMGFTFVPCRAGLTSPHSLRCSSPLLQINQLHSPSQFQTHRPTYIYSENAYSRATIDRCQT